MGGRLGAGHVRALGHGLHPVLQQGPRGGLVELVLGGTRQGHGALDVPDAAAGHVAGPPAAALGVLGDAGTLDLLDLLEQVQVEAVRVHDVARGVGRGEHGGPERGGLLRGVDGHVAGAGDQHLLTVHGFAARAQHGVDEHHGAVAGGLSADQRAAPRQALAGEGAGLEAVGQSLVLAEHVADLAGAHADVTGRHVRVLTDVAMQLRHEGLAEPHDLAVGLAGGVEVRAALAAADRHAGERVLEDLLEAQELDDPEVHGGVEAQPALVRAERRVELHAEPAVDLHDAGVVDPRDAEDDLALRLAEAVHDPGLDVLGVALHHRSQRLEHLGHRLVELGLAGVAREHFVAQGLQRLIHGVLLGRRGRDAPRCPPWRAAVGGGRGA
ncbi:Uncharacterised protein [Streptococcus pneumoniae]|nr:Uncharacterised protein [Streptococcus pneumoniae]